ncbi:phosphoribosylglycinamide formyltransferase [Eubacterium aggregans]|uniref:phosphoribosylglycinamide formyltransferase n=1 Tax=Eubacterium aggregans TaxID=81409 RepID=UPI003F37662B
MLKIGVLVSGGGTDLQSVIDGGHGKTGEIALVLSNNPEAYGLTRARSAGIPTAVVVEADCDGVVDFNGKMVEALQVAGVELVVLAGFMRIITPNFVAAYPQAIINIHPALIPAFCGEGFYGMHVHNAVYDYGVKVTGATVHFVNEEADGGPIIAQRVVEILDDDTPESIQKRVLAVEHELLPWVVEQFCLGRVSVDGRHVRIDGSIG